jgi:hypothetical protein
MPAVSGVTVVTCLRAFYFCTQGCGRIERPAFPAPSVLGGQDVKAKLARNPRRGREGVAALFAGSNLAVITRESG